MFYNNLKTILDKKGISLNKLCSKIGISYGNVTHWKRGIIPSLKMVYKIAEYLNISVNDLLINVEPEEIEQKNKPTVSEDDRLTNAILKNFKKLAPETQEQLLKYADFLLAQEQQKHNN